mmetsp:Transcript_29190/g.75142  ORF Transcript_29190/g.75142 Transcript_29190/m.75142 type:complete len:239 (+) Transcript_29190:813-1529(+)
MKACFFESPGNVHVADRGKKPTKEAHQDGDTRVGDHVSSSAYGYTSSKSGVLDVFHLELASTSQHAAEDEGTHAAARHGEHSVGDDPFLHGSICEGTVEGWPKHPQKESSDHAECVRHVALGLVRVTEARFGADHSCETNAEVCAERVHHHGSTCIRYDKQLHIDDLVDTEEDHLEYYHQNNLGGRCLANHSSEGDEGSTSSEVTGDQCCHVHVDGVKCRILVCADVDDLLHKAIHKS